MSVETKVNIALAVLTFFAVITALFREELRSWLVPPKLKLSLLPEEDGVTHTDNHKWRHLHVSNPRRRSPVRNVRVCLQSLRDATATAGEYIWRGDAPVWWRYEKRDVETAVERTVGGPIDCDLCSALKPPANPGPVPNPGGPPAESSVILLQLKVEPGNAHLMLKKDKTYHLEFIARGDEADSNLLKLKIKWNGDWNASDKAFAGMLQISVL